MDRRYHYVDLLRGLAAIAVLVCHYRWFFARYPDDWRLDISLPGDSVLWPLYDYGGLAVELFWVLSGFVFAVAYGRFGKGLSVRKFWIHRVARLYPLHILTLLIVAALQALSWRLYGDWQVYPNNDLPHFLLQLAFASNWFTMAHSFNAPIWSVSIEVLIYFLFLFYLKRFGLSLWAALGIAAGSFVIERLTLSAVALSSALFFAGVITAMLQDRLGRWWLGLAGAIGSLALYSLTGSVTVLYYGFCPAALSLFVALDLQVKSLPQSFHWIGLSTYSIYLLHIPVLISFRLSGYIPPLWLFASLVIGLSYVAYRWFEAPAQTWVKGIGKVKPARTEFAD